MKKKLVIVSDESIISGNAGTGMADVTDGLANALSSCYNVTVVCPDGNGSIPAKMAASKDGYLRKFTIAGTTYILVDPTVWEQERAAVVDSLQPDILHNMSHPAILSQLCVRPNKTVYTIDHASYIVDKVADLSPYDHLTTVSKGYAEELLAREDALSEMLQGKSFVGITNGLTTALCNPKTGVMIPHSFSSMNMSGKVECKKALLKRYGIEGNPPIFIAICRLIKEKGAAAIIEAASHIADVGGILLIYGRGDTEFEEALEAQKDVVVWIHNRPQLHKALPILAGADFYLSPSKEEACGLMPMTASLYGTIPIVTQVGGLRDNFNEKNALIVTESLNASIDEAVALYTNPLKLAQKRGVAMRSEFDWSYRVDEYVALYED